MCIAPVGEGAIRVTTGRSGIELEDFEESAPGAGAAPLSMRLRRLPSLPQAPRWLIAQLERQSERWALWVPVALGGGAGLYFALLREPQTWIALALLPVVAAMLGAATIWSRARVMTAVLVLLASGLGGFALAKLRTEHVKAPVAGASARPQWLQGWVVDVASPGQGGQRLFIAPYRIGDWASGATPIRVRVTLRGGYIPAPGEPIQLLAVINTPPQPASPGAYDFARDAYFESVGGVGFSLSAPQTWAAPYPPPWRLRMTMQINAVRWALTRRIVDTLGLREGGLAAAMTTGHDAFIPKSQVDDLRTAGLAHIISISGLHMAIVGGFVFALLRFAIAAWPWLALRVPGKKIAAALALAAVAAYLVLSGWPPPAERSAITAAVAFGAILVDRQAISLRALALAAIIVILLQPEAVTQPGFQMSFAATAALVALAEIWPRPVREINVPWPIKIVQGAWTWLAAGAAASFVAGLATAPIAMQDFNRVSTWGLVSNLLSEPISGFLMMPGLALGALLTPVGLGEWPLHVAGFAIDLLNRIAHAAANAPYALIMVASGPDWTLPAAFVGILWLCLWKGPLRWIGLPLAMAVQLAPKPPTPDVWASNDGSAVAVRQGRDAVLMRPDVKLFGAELWARRRGLTPLETEAARDAGYACDHWSCAPGAAAPIRVAAAWNVKRPLKPGRLDELCSSAELVILRNDFRPEACAAPVVLTGPDFDRGGSAELYREGPGRWRIVWAQDIRGRRPWTWGPDPRLTRP
jgi:competence protein ComEC